MKSSLYLKEIFNKCEFPAINKTPDDYKNRLTGALLGRFAGCTLGVLVENYPVEKMREIAKKSGTPFPPTEYWHEAENPDGIQYGVDKRTSFTLGHIDGVPVDDDVTYTILNMILLKRYGKNYTVDDVGKLWLEILPYACTAEECALNNLKNGVCAEKAAEGNDFIEWIGAAIRADAFGYVCAGNPEAAAKLCVCDAYLSHRENGIYGEMFASAAIAAAFITTPIEAIKIGMECIPKDSALYKDLKWAISYEDTLVDYAHARKLLDERFEGMHCVHVQNNMCAVVFAVILGKGDYTKTISQSVAMGMDNDCNAATVGSIVGAYVGIDKVPEHWYKPFNNKVRTYLKGYENLKLTDVIDDFVKLHEEFSK